MSFILDALRKSEHERQRQTGPGIADLRSGTARGRGFPIWAIALAGLLAANLILVLVLVVRGSFKQPASEPSAASSQPIPSAVAASVPPPAEVLSPMEPLTEPTSLPALPAPPSTSDQQLSELELSEEAPPVRPDPELRPVSKPAASAGESLPTLSEVMLKGSVAPPEMHLDIHVYAERPAGRFVSINGRKYVEGEKTAEGAQLERISPEGVVLNYQGTRFLLPRE